MNAIPISPSVPLDNDPAGGPQPQTQSAPFIVTGGMPSSSESNIVQFPANSIPFEKLPDNLSPKQAAAWIGYGNSDSFLVHARATGLPICEINARVLRIDKQKLREWRDRRTA